MGITEMMKKYEAYTGVTLEEAKERWKTSAFCSGYMEWLESKAAAYDRLMSGEGCEYCKGLTIANEHSTEVFINHEDGCTLDVLSDNWRIQIDIKYCPKCGKPLTLPDRWEEKQ